MALDRKRTSRNYLFGRLFAVAHYLEKTMLRDKEKNRETNAERLEQSFFNHPYSTWPTLKMAIKPYMNQMRSRKGGLLCMLEKEIDDILNSFSPEDFKNNNSLDGEFYLGYSAEDSWIYTSKENKIAALEKGGENKETTTNITVEKNLKESSAELIHRE